MRTLTLAFLIVFSRLPVAAQNFRISTIAGFGTYSGDGGSSAAALANPAAVVADGAGNVYFSDYLNNRIRKINSVGIITTVIGLGYSIYSGDGGPAAAAGISYTLAMALDSSGNLYFTDDGNNRVREILTNGIVRTVAGNGICAASVAGALAVNTSVCGNGGLATDAQGRVYFGSSDQVWMIGTDGKLVLVAGFDGGVGKTGDGGPATLAQIGFPGSLAFDQAGNLYLADLYNFVIRKITTNNQIGTVIAVTDTSATTIQVAVDATNTLFYVDGRSSIYNVTQGVSTATTTLTSPANATCLGFGPGGVIYVCSTQTQTLLRISAGLTAGIAGAYPYGVESLPQSANNVHLQLPAVDGGIAVDAAGNVYFAELDNNLVQRIDKLTPAGVLSTLNTPAKLPNTNIDFIAAAIAIGPSGLIYFSTFTQVYRLEANGSLTLIAGGPGFPANLGDGGSAVAAKVTSPVGLAFDAAGNLYIAEAFDGRVRKVTPQGIITTFAGTGQQGYSGDGGLATSASLAAPVDLKFDAAGNLYIADVSAAVVRKVNTSGIITTVAGNGTHGFTGDGGLATKAELSGAAAIATDPSGNLFIADRSQAGGVFVATTDNNRIRMVNTAGIISTVAGGFSGYNGENVVSNLAASGGPVALVSDSQGNIYTEEATLERIRKLTPAPAVVIYSVNTAGGYPDIAQNGWIEIRGANLAPLSLGPGGAIWSSAPEFTQGKMPTQLSNVSVTVNGKPAFVYFVSFAQVNVLPPLDGTTGNVSIVVTNNGVASAPFTVKMVPAAPSFLRYGATSYIVATHGNGSLLSSPSLSVPGYPFTAAKPSETFVIYAVGFGATSTALVNGSSSQFGVLATNPVIQVNGVTAQVVFAGINGVPGLYQFNVVVPPGTPDGDLPITASYAGVSTLISGITVSH